MGQPRTSISDIVLDSQRQTNIPFTRGLTSVTLMDYTMPPCLIRDLWSSRSWIRVLHSVKHAHGNHKSNRWEDTWRHTVTYFGVCRQCSRYFLIASSLCDYLRPKTRDWSSIRILWGFDIYLFVSSWLYRIYRGKFGVMKKLNIFIEATDEVFLLNMKI